jgi:cytochrome c oxidase cbb3-type subunit IV
VDINDLRSIVTVVSMLLFLGLAAWTWQSSRRAAFDEAAQLPFAEDSEGDAKGDQP